MTFTETILPLLVLVALAILLPHLLCPRATLSHWRLSGAILGSATLVFLTGALLFAALYLQQGKPVAERAAALPLQSLLYFARRSGLLVPVWTPILVLVWLIRAQAVEARRGLALADPRRTPPTQEPEC